MKNYRRAGRRALILFGRLFCATLRKRELIPLGRSILASSATLCRTIIQSRATILAANRPAQQSALTRVALMPSIAAASCVLQIASSWRANLGDSGLLLMSNSVTRGRFRG
jgi:hypothetical protein